MEAVTEKKSERTDVTIIGRVDSMSAPELERKLMEILESGETRLLLNMEGTEYLSSAGIRTILRIAKRLEALGGSIQFRGVRGMVLDVFTMTGIDRVFHLEDEAFSTPSEDGHPSGPEETDDGNNRTFNR